MSNPTVIEWGASDQAPATQVHTHSTTQPNRSKFCFKDLSVARVDLHDRRIREVYGYIASRGGHNLTKQYDRCRTDAWLVQHEDTRELRIASRKCNQRWCPMCQKTKRWIITSSVGEWVTDRRYAKFVTFTLKSSSESLEFQVERLYESFKVMRRKSIWRTAVRGGIWFFQLTINATTKQWHPHIHVLVDSDYMPVKQLSRTWFDITHDSFIVDIRKVEDPEKAAEYVARYATIPGEILKCSIRQAAAMVIGLKGRRMCGAFGSAKGIALRPRSSTDHLKWRKVMSFCAFVVGSQLDPYIQAVAKALDEGKPYAFEIWGLYDTPEMPPDVLRFAPESVAQMHFEFDDCYYVKGCC